MDKVISKSKYVAGLQCLKYLWYLKNDQEASLRYLNITFLKGEKESDKVKVEKIRKDLLDYCGLDTEGMIFILRELYKII